MLDTNTIAESLFEKIRAQFEKVNVGDKKAKATTVPSEARFFNFDFTDSNGENFGNVTISLIDEHSLKIYFGKNVSANLDEQQKTEWYDFLRDMRLFAKRNLLSFDTRDISRSNLNIKDLKQLAASEKPATTHDTNVAESKLYGTTKTSYEPIAHGTKLIIRHNGAVDETIHGARSRKIQSVYVEDSEGQRFKTPFTHLGGARALGQHVANGGQFNDEFGTHLTELVQEMGKIKKFIQGSRNKTFEDGEATDMVSAAKERYRTIHHILHRLKGPRGYKMYKEEYMPEAMEVNAVDLPSLRKKFTQSKFDDRLEDALPHVYKAYNAMKPKLNNETTSQINAFESWADEISEGTWAVPEEDLEVQKLQELMSQPLLAGVDGNDASAALYDILGDDRLFDSIYDASVGSPDMDVRPIVYDWLEKNMPSVSAKIDVSLQQGTQEQPEPQPEQSAQPPDQGEEQAPEPKDQAPPEDPTQKQRPTESVNQKIDMLIDIRRLAGLK